MKFKYKLVSLILIICVLVSFSGCFDFSYIDETADTINSTLPEEEQVLNEAVVFNLPYLVSDHLNPYNAKSEINQSLTSLMYDSLFSVDNSFKSKALIAKSFSFKDGVLIVKIRDDVSFSDLSRITSSDVVNSFDIAKKSERYKTSLSIIESANQIDNYTVEFELVSNNKDICSLLTFPIIRSLNDAVTDDYTDVPIGSGRYILSSNTNNELYLTANQNHISKTTPICKNIGLVATTDEETISSNFALGYTNVLIDSYSDGVYEKYIGASTKQNLTNLVYLVCNPKNEIFKDSNVKKAISYAIDRDEIADYSFISYAKPAVTPFHPEYYRLKDFDSSSLKYNTNLSIEILEKTGYDEINPRYNFRHSDGKVLKFDLIVNKDNPFKLSAAQLIKKNLNDVSISVNIIACTQEDFIKRVKSGDYDIYLGECKLSDNFDLSVFFDSGSSASYGIDLKSTIKESYESYINEETEITEFITDFSNDLPFIPLLYRCASVNSNSAMSVSCSSIVSDYYNNIDKWKTVND